MKDIRWKSLGMPVKLVLAVLVMLLAVPGCVVTSAITELGSALSEEDDTAAPPPTPVVVTGEENDQEISSRDRILKLLRQADEIRF